MLSEYNELVEVSGELYYCQGYSEDAEISMYRPYSQVFEFEKDCLERIEEINEILED